MLESMRGKLGQLIVTAIVAVIAGVFAFEGVFRPKWGGGGDQADAGRVNGDPITLSEFNRALERRTEFFKSMTGGQLNEAQLKAFRVREGVFSELVNRKLMAQAALKNGMTAGDEELRDKIQEMPVFQKDGKFDFQQYKQLLQSNGLSEARFETMMREDLSLESWNHYFHDRVKVSDEEVRQEFLANGDQRNIKYVLVTPQETAAAAFPEADVRKFAQDPANSKTIHERYEAGKALQFKGQTQDAAELRIAREMLAEKSPDVARKAADKVADQVVAALTADKASDARVDAILKPYGLSVKSTGKVNRSARYLPGIGEARDLMNDAFAVKSPIDPKEGGKAKKYNSASWYLVAVVTESDRPDLAKFDQDREKLTQQVASRKERELYEAWLKKLTEKAKIESNPAVVGDGKEEAGA